MLNNLVEAPLTIGQSYFGSVVVQQIDLDAWTTGYPDGSLWGARVAVAMRELSNRGTQVIVRSKSFQPNSAGSVSPDTVVTGSDGIIAKLAWRNWMRRIQVDNEPNSPQNNGGWVDACTGCHWSGSSRSYSWQQWNDLQRYQAINEWYTQVRQKVKDWYNNHDCPHVNPTDPNAFACYNLTHRITLWTPPLDPGQANQPLHDGSNAYNVISGMIYSFDCNRYLSFQRCFSYHDYPSPMNTDGELGITNISWFHFPFSLKLWLTTNDPRNVRSEITEFGWDPGLMNQCGIGQADPWPGSGPCAAADHHAHYFQGAPTGDVSYYLQNKRNGAAMVGVWIESGWNEHSDGISVNQTTWQWQLRNWFLNYQAWSP